MAKMQKFCNKSKSCKKLVNKYKLEFTLTGINGALPFFLCWSTIICQCYCYLYVHVLSTWEWIRLGSDIKLI